MDILLLLALLVLLALPTILMNKRQRTKMSEIQKLQEALRPGDRVVTTAGLHADVVSLNAEQVVLEIAPGVVTTWEKMSVVRVLESSSDIVEATPDAAFDTEIPEDVSDFEQDYTPENNQRSDFHPENYPEIDDDQDRSYGHPENR